MPLAELATYIRKYKHLPGVPSARHVEKDGINVGDNLAILLRKIEELTLHLIEMERKVEEMKVQNDQLKNEIINSRGK